jgi:hypothetical protein
MDSAFSQVYVKISPVNSAFFGFGACGSDTYGELF